MRRLRGGPRVLRERIPLLLERAGAEVDPGSLRNLVRHGPAIEAWMPREQVINLKLELFDWQLAELEPIKEFSCRLRVRPGGDPSDFLRQPQVLSYCRPPNCYSAWDMAVEADYLDAMRRLALNCGVLTRRGEPRRQAENYARSLPTELVTIHLPSPAPASA